MTLHSHRSQYNAALHGFTLIELLVVMVIISVLAGMAVLAIGGNDYRELRSEAKRLHRVLQLAVEEAAYRQTQYGLDKDDSGYQVLEYDRRNGQWRPLSSEPAFAHHALPDPVETELVVEGELTEAFQEQSSNDSTTNEEENDGESLQPEVLILASGEMTPFEFELQLRDEPDRRARLTSDGLSMIELEFVSYE